MPKVTSNSLAPIHQRDFSMKKPTQHSDKQLHIKGTEDGLKVSVGSDNSQIYQIQSHMIRGLPKTSFVPKEFFDMCYAKLTTHSGPNSEYGVRFGLPLQGGMEPQALTESNEIAITGLPGNTFEVQEFYNRTPVTTMVAQLKDSGNYSLGDVVEFLKTGADAVNIAYLAGRSLPKCGPLLTGVKDQYSLLVSETSGEFIDMQTNNLLVIEGHISASEYMKIGQLENTLTALKNTEQHANKNIESCSKLLKIAEGIRGELSSCKSQAAKLNENIISGENEMEALNKDLKIVREKIEDAKNEERKVYAKEKLADTNERYSKTVNAFTFGLIKYFGGQMD